MKRLRITGAVAVVAAIAAGTTYATTAVTGGASATNTIQACVKAANGDVRIVDSATQCHRDEHAVTWNVQGPVGPKGDKGDQGVKGDTGAPGQSVTEADAGANCSNGGVALTAANGTAYVCNGKDGKDGQNGTSFTSIGDLAGLGCTTGGQPGVVVVGSGAANTITLTCQITGGGSTGGGGGGGGDTSCNGTGQPVPNGSSVCSNGTWSLICNAGYADANNNPADGCEVNLLTDPNNCGGVGNAATLPNATAGCVNGLPVIVACNPGYYDVDKSALDGCESTNPSGGCDHLNGLGGTYTDCSNPLGTPTEASTYNSVMAHEAAAGIGTPTDVTCGGYGSVAVIGGGLVTIWTYAGPAAGFVKRTTGTALTCPAPGDPTWN